MNARLALKVVISTALMGFLLWSTPLSEVIANLKAVDHGPIAFSVLVSFAAWGLSALRLWVLLPEYPFRRILSNTFIGLYYGTLLPGQVAGDLVKAYKLSKEQVTPGRAIAATALDRVIGICALLALGSIAAFFTPGLSTPVELGSLVIALGAFASTCLLLSKRFLHSVGRFIQSVPVLEKLTLVKRFISGLLSISATPRELGSNLLIGLGFHALCVALHAFSAAALGIDLPLATWCFVYAAVSVIVLLPISIAGLGLREGGYIGLLGLFNVAPDKAFSLSIIFLCYSLLGALAGWVVDVTGAGTNARPPGES